MSDFMYDTPPIPGSSGYDDAPIYNVVYQGQSIVLSPAAEAVKGMYMNADLMNMTPAAYIQSLTPDYPEFDNAFDELDEDEDWDDDDDEMDDVLLDLTLAAHYQMEKSDHQHRMGDLLASAFSVYDRLRNPQNYVGSDLSDLGHPAVNGMFNQLQINAQKMTLYKWLDSIPEYPRICMISSHPLMKHRERVSGKIETGNLLPSMVVAFVKGVKYLDGVGRKRYELDVNGAFSQNGTAFSTDTMKTVHSGMGFAIWVCGGPDSKFYAGNHAKGQFHHSSFLAGGDVVCGGEMVARNGQLKLLTAKTGHYQADMDHFVKAIGILTASGIAPDSYRVLVWDENTTNAPKNPAPFARDILADPDDYITWGTGSFPRTAWDL